MNQPSKPVEQITIFLSTIEAEQFKRFQKYHHLFSELEKNKALEIEFGKVTINIAYNEVQNIVKEEVVFHNKKK